MLALFSDRLLRFTPFTADRRAPRAPLRGDPGGRRHGGQRLPLHVAQAPRRPPGASAWWCSSRTARTCTASCPPSDVLWKARAGQALIYWIQLGGKHKSFTSSWRDFKANDQEYETSRRRSRRAAGAILAIERLEELGGRLPRHPPGAARAVRLGYYPTNSKGDGTLAQGRGPREGFGGRVRTREGYADY